MNNLVSEDVGIFLQQNGKISLGVDTFINEFNMKVDAQLVISDTGAFDSDLYQSYEKPTFQLLYRGKKKEGSKIAYTKIRTIYDFLVSKIDVPIGNQLYDVFVPMGGIVPLGRDEEDRFLYSANFYTMRDTTENDMLYFSNFVENLGN